MATDAPEAVPDEELAALARCAQATGGDPTGARRLLFALWVHGVARSSGADVGQPHRFLARWWARPPPAGVPEGDALNTLAADLAPRDANPRALVTRYERLLGSGERKQRGAFYTPPAIVDGVLDDALGPLLDGPLDALLQLRVCDPACGAGAFLLAAQQRLVAALVARGVNPTDAARHTASRALHGVDADPDAAELCRGLIWLASGLPVDALAAVDGVRHGDALWGATPALGGDAPDAWCAERAPSGAPFFHWHLAFPAVFHASRGRARTDTAAHGGFDVVVGNPPFLNQLQRRSARGADARRLLEARFDGDVRGYADTASAFLRLGAELLRDRGRLTLVLPLSTLAARDAAPIRRRLHRLAQLDALWIAREPVFPTAAVDVWAPTFVRRDGSPARPVRRRVGPTFDRAGPADPPTPTEPTWGRVVADLCGVPPVRLDGPPLSTLARATADFRDQYYGLRGCVIEDDAVPGDADPSRYPPLVTTGLVDPAKHRWGARPTRFDRRRWRAPRVDLSRLERDAALGAWAAARLVPKVLLATQTQVLEAVVDDAGAWLPSVPLLSIVPDDPEHLWHLAAALCAPPLTAYAASTWFGAGLSSGALKLSAAQVRALPLPRQGAGWDEAAEAVRAAHRDATRHAEHLRHAARAGCAAYGLSAAQAAPLLTWWEARLPRH